MHYYTFKPKDYMSKTAFLEPLEDLAYRRMLDHCYLTEKPLPKNIDEIAMLIRMRSHTDSIKTVLHYFFDITAEGYVNDYVARELFAYHNKSLKAKASADARWRKEKSKNKDLSSDNVQCETNANALRDNCEGNANQQPLTNNDKPLTNINKERSKKFNPLSAELPLNVDKQSWIDFVEMRNSIKKPLSELATKKILKKLESFGDSAKQAIENSIVSSWSDVYMPKQSPVYQNRNENRPPDIGAYMRNNASDFLDVTPQPNYLEHNE